MPVDDQEEHSIVVGEVGNRKRPCVGIAYLELQLVSRLERHSKVIAVLVGHWCIAGKLVALPLVNVNRCSARVRIAYTKAVLELQCFDKRAASMTLAVDVLAFPPQRFCAKRATRQDKGKEGKH